MNLSDSKTQHQKNSITFEGVRFRFVAGAADSCNLLLKKASRCSEEIRHRGRPPFRVETSMAASSPEWISVKTLCCLNARVSAISFTVKNWSLSFIVSALREEGGPSTRKSDQKGLIGEYEVFTRNTMTANHFGSMRAYILPVGFSDGCIGNNGGMVFHALTVAASVFAKADFRAKITAFRSNSAQQP